MNSSYQPRFYRKCMGGDRFAVFTAAYKETDLWIGVDKGHYSKDMREYAIHQVKELRAQLERYIEGDPGFYKSLSPYRPGDNAPPAAHCMARASARAGVGPMAAVAGTIAQEIGRRIEERFKVREIIVENGGDLYLKFVRPVLLSVYAGASPLSGKIGLEACPSLSPVGICTSSGTVGHSLSFGKSDAVTVMCRDTATADAYATAFGNRIHGSDDVRTVLEASASIEEILGIVIIAGDIIGARGRVRIVPLG